MYLTVFNCYADSEIINIVFVNIKFIAIFSFIYYAVDGFLFLSTVTTSKRWLECII